MEICLFDGHCRKNLFPFTEIRHTAEIRVGILTIREKWERLTGLVVNLVAERAQNKSNKIYIGAEFIPTKDNFQKIIDHATNGSSLELSKDIAAIRFPWEISQCNFWAIGKDFDLLKDGESAGEISKTNGVLHESNIFVAKGAQIEFSVLNAAEGPIYIGSNVQVMEGSLIRGPVAICDNAVVKMGTKLYGGTTIGPNCIAGGEIKNSILFANSNKAHDGYLGDSVIGEWCNLGAGTSNSNLKNNAGDIFFSRDDDNINAGNKAGLMLGDYSRAAINTSFNTGTIVGICCNIFASGLPPRYIPSFTWGIQRYRLDEALRDVDKWKKLKNQSLNEPDKIKLTELYNKQL